MQLVSGCQQSERKCSYLPHYSVNATANIWMGVWMKVLLRILILQNGRQEVMNQHKDFSWTVLTICLCSGTLLAVFVSVRVVSGSRDATLRVWDIETGQCLHVLMGHVAAVRCVQYDGRRVVSGAYDFMVKVWDPETETCLHTLQGHTNRVYSLQVSSFRRTFISVCVCLYSMAWLKKKCSTQYLNWFMSCTQLLNMCLAPASLQPYTLPHNPALIHWNVNVLLLWI